MNKLISLLMAVVLILSCLSFDFVFALTRSEMDAMDNAELRSYLISNGNSNVNDVGRELNVDTYRKYELIVYDDPYGELRQGEKRYLGYAIDDTPITNDAFPDLYENESVMEKAFVKPTKAIDTWFNTYPEQVEQCFKAKPIKNDGEWINFSIGDILHKYAFSNEDRKNYTLLQVAPTILSWGSVRTNFKRSNGITYYDTFSIPAFNYFEPNITIESDKTFTLPLGVPSIDIPFTVDGTIDMAPVYGVTKDVMISTVKLTHEGMTKTVPSSDPVASFTKTVKASDLKIGQNTVKLNASGYFQSRYGDKMTREATTNVNVIKLDPSDPTVTLSPKATPDYVKFNDADIPIAIDLKSQLFGYTNLANVKEVKLYARFSDDVTAKQLTLAPGFIGDGTFSFSVPKAKLTADHYTQEFVTSAVYVLRNPFNGKHDLRDTKNVTALIYKTAVPPPPSTNTGKPPIADIITKKIIKAGEDTIFDGRGSHDPDGSIVSYAWNIPSFIGGLTGDRTDGWFAHEGTYTSRLTVVDNDGSSDEDTEVVTVLPGTPSLILKALGTHKVNRKVTLDMTSSTSPTHYPIVPGNTTISIVPVSGGGMASDIKVNGSLNGSLSVDVLFKHVGDYKVTATIYNTKGYRETVETTLTITEDLPPVANFAVQNIALRDPDDGNKHTLIYTDISYSTDNDFVAKNIYTIRYDNNNNGLADDGIMTIDSDDYTNGETKTITAWGQALLVTVDKAPHTAIKTTLKGEYVGKYRAELDVVEGFGQDTIPAFIVASDYLTDDTTDKLAAEKLTEVKNVAPVASIELIKKKKVDFVIVTDYTGAKLATLQSELETLKSEMLGNNVDIKFIYVNGKKNVGIQSKVVTNYYYARRTWVRYQETGSDQMSPRDPYAMSWSNRWVTQYGEYEGVWQDIPNALPGFSKPLAYSVSPQGFSETSSNPYFYSERAGTRYIFYDPANYSGTQRSVEVLTKNIWGGSGSAYVMNSNSITNVTYGIDNYWANTGSSQNKTLTYNVSAVDFDNIGSLSFRTGTEKVMMIFSDNNSTDYSYTNPSGTGFSFSSLNAAVRNVVINNNMAVYTVVPDDALDLKFNATSSYNTNITSQLYSLREMVNSSPVRGKFLDRSSWKESLGYLMFAEPMKSSTVTIDNNVVKIKLSDLVGTDDYILNYIKYKNIIMDTVGNTVDALKDVVSMNIIKFYGPPELYNGFILEDAVGSVNNGKIAMRLGSPKTAGNNFRYFVSFAADPINVPAINADVTTWPIATNGSNIICPNGYYVGVAEVDGSNKVVRFTQLKATTIDEQ